MLTGPILVPLDGSELAARALPFVERLASRDACTVHLLRVTGGPDAVFGGPDPTTEAQVAKEYLRAMKARLEQKGLRVETHLADGDPAAEVQATAARVGAALIALTSHGRSGLLRWIRGSVAEAVLREATAPVLLVSAHTLVKDAPARFRRILVPLDGTERAASVLPHVIALAGDPEAEVILLRVEWTGGVLLASLLPHEEASLRPVSEQLTAAGVASRVLAARGDAAAEILDVADRVQADLVAMATHGRSGMTRFVAGSVAEKVLRHCRHPLLVVRTPD